MRGFGIPELPKFEKKDLSELSGQALAKFLKGLGIDLSQLLPIAQGMHDELAKLNDRMERIEAHIIAQNAKHELHNELVASVAELRQDTDELREIVRLTVPEAGAAMYNMAQGREPEATIAGLPVEDIAPIVPRPADGAMTAEEFNRIAGEHHARNGSGSGSS
jgi:hypothetical protein